MAPLLLCDYLDWLYADLQPAERQEKVERLAPRLMDWISEGQVSLWLALFQHMKRMPLKAFKRWG